MIILKTSDPALLDIQHEIKDASYIITLNRPKQKNALRNQDYLELINLLNSAENNPNIKLIVLQGQPGVFTAGNDLAAFAEPEKMMPEAPPFQFLHYLNQLKKPFIVAVNGLAIGIGVTLLLHADYVLASTQSWFQMPFVNLGVCPEGAATYLLAKNAGYLQASRYLMLGERFEAEMAARLGLVTEITDDMLFAQRLQEIRHSFEKQPIEALLITKRLLKSAKKNRIDEVIKEEAINFKKLLMTDECQNRVAQMAPKNNGQAS